MTNIQVVVLLKHSSQTVVAGQEVLLVVSVIVEGESVVLVESLGAALAPASKLKSSTVSFIKIYQSFLDKNNRYPGF